MSKISKQESLVQDENIDQLIKGKAVRLKSIVQVDNRTDEEKKESLKKVFEPIIQYRMVVRAPFGCECHACFPQKDCLCSDCKFSFENNFLWKPTTEEIKKNDRQHYSPNCMCYSCQKQHQFSPFIKHE